MAKESFCQFLLDHRGQEIVDVDACCSHGRSLFFPVPARVLFVLTAMVFVRVRSKLDGEFPMKKRGEAKKKRGIGGHLRSILFNRLTLSRVQNLYKTPTVLLVLHCADSSFSGALYVSRIRKSKPQFARHPIRKTHNAH